ncbi:MAG: thioesterase family protein [Cyanobacteria bacterium P01_D01_bin.73]
MAFSYSYRVKFGDTDGAGVVYFARFLEICHGAYEASLAASGIVPQDFFSGKWLANCLGNAASEDVEAYLENQEVRQSIVIAVPIVETWSRFYHPCVCGDLLTVGLWGELIDKNEFKIHYEWRLSQYSENNIGQSSEETERANSFPAGTAMTRHICTYVKEGRPRGRYPMPPALSHWLAFVGFKESNVEEPNYEEPNSKESDAGEA